MAGGMEYQVTAERIGAALDSADYQWELDEEGDFRVRTEKGTIWIVRRGDDWGSPYLHALWRGELDEGELTDAIVMCNSWNAEYLSPKAYAKRNDEGGVKLLGSQVIYMPFGSSDETLNATIVFMLGSGAQMFDYFTEIFAE